MAQVQWIKLSTGMFSESRKIRQIEQMPECDTILVIWLKLMLLAGQVNDGGKVYITQDIPYTEEELAYELRRPLEAVQRALRVFERFKMIKKRNGVLILSSWEKYQNVEGLDKLREQKRAAQKRYRERKKQEETPARDTTGDITVIPRDKTEEEREEEEKEEKESTDVIRTDAHSLSFVEDEDIADAEGMEEARRRRQRMGGNLGRGVVMLSDEQIDSLLDQLTKEEFDHYVSVIAENELKGNHYSRRTHYQAILDMAAIDRKT